MRVSTKGSFLTGGLSALAVIVAMAAVPAGATTITTLITFEPTDPAVYVAGNSIIGVDGWFDQSGGGDATKARVTPIPAGESRVISGTQSVVVKAQKIGTSTKYKGYVQRPFDEEEEMFIDGMTLSWDMIPNGAAGNVLSGYLGNDNAAVATAAGVQATIGGDFSGFGATEVHGAGANFSDAAVPMAVAVGNLYKCEMVLDFTYGGFEAFVTDVTGGGARTSLGKRYFVDTELVPCTPEHLASVGGILLTAKNNGAVAIFDDFTVTIPEPSTLAMLAAGLVGLLACARRKS